MDVVFRWSGARGRAIAQRLARLRPRSILAIGWLGLFAYAYPGYMSFDPIQQLGEARSGDFGDWHPPAMAALWRLVECVVAGPVGMLVIQSGCFLIGAYLLLRRAMSERAAAVCASCLLLFPSVSAVMGVIWKDSQMAGFLMLGTALVLTARRRDRIAGLAVLLLASLMRHNAFTMTFPLVILLFQWNLEHRGLRRYAVGAVAWVAITAASFAITARLTRHPQYTWYRSSGLIDIVGTLRYSGPLTDEQIHPLLEGLRVVPTHDLGHAVRRAYNPSWAFDAIWPQDKKFFDEPQNDEERLAVAHAWKNVVLGHFGAYLRYRVDIFIRVLSLGHPPPGSPIYVWFSDVQDPFGSAQRIQHLASPSRLQHGLQVAMIWLGTTWLFHVYVYLILALALLAFCRRDRTTFALLASGLTGEAALFFAAPTTDYRYSFWLVVVTVMAVMLVVARRAGATAADPMPSPAGISDASGPRRR